MAQTPEVDTLFRDHLDRLKNLCDDQRQNMENILKELDYCAKIKTSAPTEFAGMNRGQFTLSDLPLLATTVWLFREWYQNGMTTTPERLAHWQQGYAACARILMQEFGWDNLSELYFEITRAIPLANTNEEDYHE